MIIASIMLFFIAAFLGATLLFFVLQGKSTPKTIVFMHGPIAVTGIVLLALYALWYKPAPIISLILFVLAAMGGAVLFYKDITGKSLPKALAVGHGLIAVAGFIFLLIFAFV